MLSFLIPLFDHSIQVRVQFNRAAERSFSRHWLFRRWHSRRRRVGLGCRSAGVEAAPRLCRSRWQQASAVERALRRRRDQLLRRWRQAGCFLHRLALCGVRNNSGFCHMSCHFDACGLSLLHWLLPCSNTDGLLANWYKLDVNFTCKSTRCNSFCYYSYSVDGLEEGPRREWAPPGRELHGGQVGLRGEPLERENCFARARSAQLLPSLP